MQTIMWAKRLAIAMVFLTGSLLANTGPGHIETWKVGTNGGNGSWDSAAQGTSTNARGTLASYGGKGYWVTWNCVDGDWVKQLRIPKTPQHGSVEQGEADALNSAVTSKSSVKIKLGSVGTEGAPLDDVEVQPDAPVINCDENPPSE